jgi:hypothetical protein
MDTFRTLVGRFNSMVVGHDADSESIAGRTAGGGAALRPSAMVVSFVAIVLLGLALAGYRPVPLAQEGTPPAAELGLPEGVAFEILASGRAEVVPPGPARFEIFRLWLEPGAGLPIPPDDPSLGIPVVESGTVAMHVTAPVTITRAAMGDVPGAQEEVAAGTEFTLNPGDSIVGSPNAGGESRNDGFEPAVVPIAHIMPEA